MKNKLKILFYMIIYDLACIIAALFLTGSEIEVTAGLIAGTLTVMFNFMVLERVVDYIIDGKCAVFAFLIHLGRFFIFGAVACLCCVLGTHALIAYGFGVLGFTAAVTADSICRMLLKPSSELKAENRVCKDKKEAVE